MTVGGCAVLPPDDGGLGLTRVGLRAAAGNKASNAVAVAAGMPRVGVARHGERRRDSALADFEVYDVLADEVLPTPSERLSRYGSAADSLPGKV